MNALSPGLIDTQIWDYIKTAVFLVSDESSYMTGANMILDGGLTSQLISSAPYESMSIDGEAR